MDAVGNARSDAAARALDITMGLEAGGFHWVQWDHAALRDAPLYRPGRFLAHPDDLLAHQQVPADAGQALAEEALVRLPRYSEEPDAALEIAKASGLFSKGEAVLQRDALGNWEVTIPSLSVTIVGDTAAEALCLAVLHWVRGPRRS